VNLLIALLLSEFSGPVAILTTIAAFITCSIAAPTITVMASVLATMFSCVTTTTTASSAARVGSMASASSASTFAAIGGWLLGPVTTATTGQLQM
jgi:hypothetical protein